MSFWNDYKQAIDPTDWVNYLSGQSPMQAASPYFNQGLNSLTNAEGMSAHYLQPYIQGGQYGMEHYQNLLGQMSNPAENYNHLMSGWALNPAQKQAQQEGLDAVSNNMAVKGLMASPTQAKSLVNYAQNNTAQQQQQYFNNLYGMQNNAMQGYGNMAHMGEGAAGQAGNAYMMGAGDLANYYQNMGSAAAAQQNANRQGLYSLLGSAAGAAGMMGGM